MVKNTGFFASEMGSWLREIRTAAGLSQDEVAARMGRRGRGRSNLISALESGRKQHPYFETIVLYLRACGAPMGVFCDKFNSADLLLVDPAAFEDTGSNPWVTARLRAKASAQLSKYQRRMRFPRAGKPLSPEQQRKGAENYREYQVQVKVIERAVCELPALADAALVEVPSYLTYARMVLSALRRYQEPALTGKLKQAFNFIERHELDAEIGRRIEALVVRRFRAMAEKF